MYVDESGDGSLNPYKDESSKYLCLTGVIINNDDYDTIENELKAIKFVHFDIDPLTSNYPLHRKELTKKTHPFQNLVDDTNRMIFDNSLKSFLSDWNFTIIAVLINKEDLESIYSKPYNPYRYGFGLLMEKYSIFLKRTGEAGDIVAESIEAKPDEKLKNTYTFLYENDFDFFHSEKFRKVLSSKQLILKKKSECCAGLEIADLIATAMKKYIIQTAISNNKIRPSFDDEIIECIKPKIFRSMGIEMGYGIKYFP